MSDTRCGYCGQRGEFTPDQARVHFTASCLGASAAAKIMDTKKATKILDDAAQERARQRVYEKARAAARKDIDRIAAEGSYKSTYDIGRAMGLSQAQIWRILREEPQRIRKEESDKITGTSIKPGDIGSEKIKLSDLVSDGYWVSCSRCDTRQRVTTNEPFVHLRNDCGDRSLKIRGPRATVSFVAKPDLPSFADLNRTAPVEPENQQLRELIAWESTYQQRLSDLAEKTEDRKPPTDEELDYICSKIVELEAAIPAHLLVQRAIDRHGKLTTEWVEGEKALRDELYGEAPQAPTTASINPVELCLLIVMWMSIGLGTVLLITNHWPGVVGMWGLAASAGVMYKAISY